jgi:hypothetical protein
MYNRQQNRMIRVAIYQLKKQYGNGPVDIYAHSGAGVNLATGVMADTPTRTRVTRAVVLPAKAQRAFVQTISKISADKPFVYGGTFDKAKRVFLIDKRDAPGLSLGIDDWLVYRGRRFDVNSFEEFEYDALWVVVASEVMGETANHVHSVSAGDALVVSDT